MASVFDSFDISISDMNLRTQQYIVSNGSSSDEDDRYNHPLILANSYPNCIIESILERLSFHLLVERCINTGNIL